MKQRTFDLVAFLVIFAAGLLAALVSFGLLKSQAEIDNDAYNLGGAAAGMVITWSVLAYLYQNLQKSGGTLEDLRRENEELRQKLIKGAPTQKDFAIEVDEKRRVVLARPSKWQPRGGVLFDFEYPRRLLRPGDDLPARLVVSFEPIEDSLPTRDEFYARYRKSFENSPYVEVLASEFMQLGGDPGLRSLKLMLRGIVEVEISKSDITDVEETIWRWLSQDEIEALTSASVDADNARGDVGIEDDAAGNSGGPNAPPLHEATLTEVAPEKVEKRSSPSPGVTPERLYYAQLHQVIVSCYCEDLNTIFYFDFTEDVDDYTSSSELFNQVLSSTRFLS